MAKKEKIIQGGETLEGELLDFQTVKEDWNIYKTEDGAKIKVKTVVAKIIRADKYNKETGEPIYIINSSNFVVAEVPDELKMPLSTKTEKTQ